MTRQERFRPEDLTGERRALYEAIAHGPRSSGPQRFPIADADGVLRGASGLTEDEITALRAQRAPELDVPGRRRWGGQRP
jgi:hypothetical protein